MILAVALAAVAAAAPSAVPAAVRLPVPALRQAPERCGPTALRMVLRYYGAPDTALAEADRAYDPALRGALVTDLAAAARRAGFEASIEAPGADSLLALLEAGVPPILLLERGIGPVSRGHYGVLVGWDPKRDRMALNDGGRSTRWLSRVSVLRSWRAAGARALLVRPR